MIGDLTLAQVVQALGSIRRGAVDRIVVSAGGLTVALEPVGVEPKDLDPGELCDGYREGVARYEATRR